MISLGDLGQIVNVGRPLHDFSRQQRAVTLYGEAGSDVAFRAFCKTVYFLMN